jgi:hypothetical protein
MVYGELQERVECLGTPNGAQGVDGCVDHKNVVLPREQVEKMGNRTSIADLPKSFGGGFPGPLGLVKPVVAIRGPSD